MKIEDIPFLEKIDYVHRICLKNELNSPNDIHGSPLKPVDKSLSLEELRTKLEEKTQELSKIKSKHSDQYLVIISGRSY